MSNEIREKDHEWVKTFHSNFDRLLALLEKLLEKRQPSAYGDELLTDKEVAYLLKVSRRTLQDYRNNGILPYMHIAEREYLRRSQRTNKPRAMSNLFAHCRAGVSSAEPKRRLSAGSRNFRAGIAATGRMSGTPVFRRFLPFPLAGLD